MLRTDRRELCLNRNLTALESRRYDVLVVGGGIFGACTAWEAASRGLTVALAERGDFSCATTANSYKIAHGGIRYLQQLDLPRVRESSREQSALLRVAPHLVHPLPILVPTYGRGLKGRAVLRAGLHLYDLLTARRNRGIPDPDRQIPGGRSMSAERVVELFPGVRRDGLTGGVVLHDAQMYSPPRLALAFLRSAVEAGAEAANYLEVSRLVRDGNRISGARARDLIDGRTIEIRARLVINATGPWAPAFLAEAADVRLGEEAPVFSRDIGLVVKRRPPSEIGLACPTATRDADAVVDRGGRHLFLLPWRDRTLVGVWHGVYSGPPDRVSVTDAELRDLLREANEAYPALELELDDVTMVNTGLILFGGGGTSDGEHKFGRRSILLDHARSHQLDGLLTLIGVRATVARGVAQKTVDLALRKLGQQGERSRTERRPIFGGGFERFDPLVEKIRSETGLADAICRSLAHNYGSRYGDVLEFGEEDPHLLRPLGGSAVLGAEVAHAVEREMAQCLMDVALRRTDLASAGAPAAGALSECAALMGRWSGWDETRVEAELQATRRWLGDRGSAKVYG